MKTSSTVTVFLTSCQHIYSPPRPNLRQICALSIITNTMREQQTNEYAKRTDLELSALSTQGLLWLTGELTKVNQSKYLIWALILQGRWWKSLNCMRCLFLIYEIKFYNSQCPRCYHPQTSLRQKYLCWMRLLAPFQPCYKCKQLILFGVKSWPGQRFQRL